MHKDTTPKTFEEKTRSDVAREVASDSSKVNAAAQTAIQSEASHFGHVHDPEYLLQNLDERVAGLLLSADSLRAKLLQEIQAKKAAEIAALIVPDETPSYHTEEHLEAVLENIDIQTAV